MVRLNFIILIAALIFTSCAKDTGEALQLKTKLTSSNLGESGSKNALGSSYYSVERNPVSLVNVRGLMDAVVFHLKRDDQSTCNYIAYSSDATSPIGTKDRAYQPFNLSSPTVWTLHKEKEEAAGFSEKNTNCNDGRAESFSIVAPYLDFSLYVENEPTIIRVSLGNYGKYHQGDVLIRRDDEFNWTDPEGEILVPESELRPENARRIKAIQNADIPSTETGSPILTWMNVAIVDPDFHSTSIRITPSTETFDIDLDLSEHLGIQIRDRRAPEKIAATFDVEAFERYEDGGFRATVGLTHRKEEKKDGIKIFDVVDPSKKQ